jgi:hypothetical protein
LTAARAEATRLEAALADARATRDAALASAAASAAAAAAAAAAPPVQPSREVDPAPALKAALKGVAADVYTLVAAQLDASAAYRAADVLTLLRRALRDRCAAAARGDPPGLPPGLLDSLAQIVPVEMHAPADADVGAWAVETARAEAAAAEEVAANLLQGATLAAPRATCNGEHGLASPDNIRQRAIDNFL